MRITGAKLNHFRNYAACEFEPCPGVNVLLGDNGQGKTNLLEALYLCCTGRSHRTRQDTLIFFISPRFTDSRQLLISS